MIIYAFLMVVVQTVVLGCYVLYCIHNFPESKLQLCNDGIFLKTISKFAGWSVLGNIAYFSYTQGLNLLLGAFFLPQVSAARAIAVQVQNAVNTFVHNFQTAVNPQITKKIASGSLNDMIVLVFRSSRFSYYLLLLITIPIMLDTRTILELWLRNVPGNTVVFTRIILITTWINSIANPLIVSVKATGQIKKYECTVGIIMLLILPVSYFFLRIGFQPAIVFYVHLFFEIIAMVFRINITSRLLDFSIKIYSFNVICKIFLVTLLSIIFPILVLESHEPGVFRLCLVVATSVFSILIAIAIFGLSPDEKSFVKSKVVDCYSFLKG